MSLSYAQSVVTGEFSTLRRRLAAARWKPSRSDSWKSPSGRTWALIGPEGPLRLESTDRLVTALVSQALLKARSTKGDAIATVILKRVSDSQHERCAEFINDVARDQPWILTDLEGRFFPHVPGENLTEHEHGVVTAKSNSTRINLFSDLNQWLAKVLLASRLDVTRLTSPRGEWKTAVALAEAADVSVAVASRFVQALDGEGWLDSRARSIEINRPLDYLTSWAESLASARLHPYRQDVHVRSVRGALDASGLREVLKHQEAKATPDAWLIGGLFTACRELGVGHVQGALETAIVPQLNASLLETNGLVRVDQPTPTSALLRVAAYPQSVRRGSVVVNGVRVTDIVQCWLDASRFRVRGAEQAELIWRRVLTPAFKDERENG